MSRESDRHTGQLTTTRDLHCWTRNVSTKLAFRWSERLHLSPTNRTFSMLWAGAMMGKVKPRADRKSTRLNSSHQIISYAVFCLKKKKNKTKKTVIARGDRM